MNTLPKSLSSFFGSPLPLAASLAAVFGIMLPSLACAQIRTDGTVGPGAQSLAGPRYQIGENLGRLSGGNLFHSFQSFNLASGESANFTTSSAGINNVISRVTGGTASQINGQISLTAAAGAPSFYFINPAGVTFGAGASIDVPGAFHVSTANSLRFADGSFNADPKAASTFSSMPPEAFGFLSGNRGVLALKDKALLSARLEQPISISAGDIVIDNARVQTTGGGNIRVAAVGGEARDVALSGPLPALAGTLTIVNGGSVMAISGSTPDIVTTVVTPGTTTTQTPATTPRGNGGSTAPQAPATTTTPDTTTTVVQAGESRNGGNILVGAGDVNIDGRGNRTDLTGIISTAVAGNSGNAGRVDIAVSGGLAIADGASIAANTYSSGNSGAVAVNAKDISIDAKGNSVFFTAIGSSAFSGTGQAGPVAVNAAGNISLVNGGAIASPTFSAGSAGSVTVNAANISIDGKAFNGVTGISSSAFDGSTGNAGTLDVKASGKLSIANTGLIDTSVMGSGNAGAVKVSAGSIAIDGQGKLTRIASSSLGAFSGTAGSLDISTPNQLSITNGGIINTSTFSVNNAGSVKVSAGSISIDGKGNAGIFTGISSSAEQGSKGSAGSVDVTSFSTLAILNTGGIASPTSSSGNAGSVKVKAADITIDGQGKITGIASGSAAGASGQAGSIDVAAANNLFLTGGGTIDSSTGGLGNAGVVRVDAGNIAIGGGQEFSRISSSAALRQTGSAGNVEVTASGNLVLSTGGSIESFTNGVGNAGTLKIQAANVNISGFAGIATTAVGGSSGNAGSIELSAAGSIALSQGGIIDSSTLGSGNGGNIRVSAGEDLSISSKAAISAVTNSGGSAGSITVAASNIKIDGTGSGIIASADTNSSGQTGSIKAMASNRLVITNGGKIAIENFATVPDAPAAIAGNRFADVGDGQDLIAATTTQSLAPTLLSISAQDVVLTNSQITAQSTGNVSASNVDVNSGSRLTMNGSSISTNANRGNGGAVNVTSRDTSINRSQITTSVTGSQGNGGDISISGSGLVLNNGFVQANTAGRNARGGNVGINVDSLIPSLGTLTVGGTTALSFNPDLPGMNVIQAAAPTGVSGNIKISSPTLNISGTLMALKYQILDTGGLGRNPCQVDKGSSLTQAGRGGLPVSSSSLQVPAADNGSAPATTPLSGIRHGDAYSRWNCRNG